jgi:hypothetical protein
METELLLGEMELSTRRRAAAARARRELLHGLKRLFRPKGERTACRRHKRLFRTPSG